MLLFRGLLFQACEVPLHVLFGCMQRCYSAACYSRPVRFRCTPYSAACNAAILPPAIPGLQSSAACLIRLHATLLFRHLLFQAGEVSTACLIRLHTMLLFRGLLFQACEVPLHALFGCMRCCYSAACYSRLAKFRCMPYSAARDAAVLLPAITGPRFPLHAYSCMRCPQPTQPSMLQPSHQCMCGPEGEYNVAITPKFWGAEAHSPRRFCLLVVGCCERASDRHLDL